MISANTILNWLLQSAFVAAIVLAIGRLARHWIMARISESVRHDFEKKLEVVRSELRAKEVQIAALRDGALSNMAARHASIAQRRLKASDDIWQIVTAYNKLNTAVAQTSILNFEFASQKIEGDIKWQEFFQITSKDFILDDVNKLNLLAESAHLYISDLTWALFTVYQTIFHSAVIKLQLLSKGVDGRKFFNFGAANEALIEALPDYKSLILEQGDKCHHQLVDVLRNRILNELRKTIDGNEQDAASIQQAASIMKVADEIKRMMDKGEVGRQP